MSEVAIPYYPVNDFSPLMKGMVIGGMGVVHVFLAQFAVGAGILMCYFQWLTQTGRVPETRRLMESYFTALVLVSFVLGALTGVGMWLTAIQVSPRTIGLMVKEFHWIWATEWTFFCLEIVSGYAFYRYGEAMGHRGRMGLLVLYASAAWFSLFWVNGILSWQLTPGSWAEKGSVWAGFFNPSFWPSLLFRTVVSATIAALVACLVVNTLGNLDARSRAVLIQRAAHLLAPMALMPLLAAWYLGVIPPESRTWALGGSAAMTLFSSLAVAVSLLIGTYASVGLLRQSFSIDGPGAALLCALAFGATAAGEFVREGVRKPYTVREVLYSNSIRPADVAMLRRIGSVARDPYPLRDAARYPNEQLRLGARVFRFQCSVCHTLTGANGLVHLAGSWTVEQRRMNIAKLQYTKPYMPPFAGTPEEVEAVVQLVAWTAAGEPKTWPVSTDAQVLERIGRWLDEAGPRAAGRDRRGER